MKEGVSIRKVILGLVLISLLFMIAGKSEMSFEFKCQGKNEATASTYSYFREPGLQDSGYTREMKAGSFNYLEKGKTIDLTENITYDYGNGSSLGNSSYTHDMKLNFNGEKGISEFYGKEFFKNNRAISAWKKIRYDNLSGPERKNYSLGDTYLAKEINVMADLSMDTTPGNGYKLTYVANVKGGVIETWDAAGWSNKTGARRIDWEHNALMRGDINVTNNLSESAPIKAHAGDIDWLPCCYNGTQPEIESIYSPWPTSRVIKTLEADTQKPNNCALNCTNGTCKKDCTNANCTQGNCPVNFNCTQESCPGYECIYTYDEGGARSATASSTEGTTTSAKVWQTYTSDISEDDANMTVITYEINIKNVGDIKIRDITVNDTLPVNMVYNGASFKYDEAEDLRLLDRKMNSIYWSIGDLASDQVKVIKLVAKYNTELGAIPAGNRVEVSGLALGVSTPVYVSSPAEPKFTPG